MEEALYGLLWRAIQSATSPMTEQNKADLKMVVTLLEEFEISTVECLREMLIAYQPAKSADAEDCPVCKPKENSKYVANYCFLCGRRTA